jgi:hypothetical protein
MLQPRTASRTPCSRVDRVLEFMGSGGRGTFVSCITVFLNVDAEGATATGVVQEAALEPAQIPVLGSLRYTRPWVPLVHV